VPTREELELRVRMIEEIGQTDPSQEIRNAVTRARPLLQSFDTAVQAQQTAEADRIAREIVDLAQSVSQLAAQRRQARPQTMFEKVWPYVGMGVLALVFLGLAGFVIYYVSGAGGARLATIEGTRPLLVIAAIISTITFGGALLLGSLFSSEGSFEERFRRAREIFLVFSGIFGTVLGFYFGAGESKGPQLSIAATLEDTTVIAYATGGTPSYKVTVTYGPQKRTKTEDTKTGWARFPFDKRTDNIIPLTASAIDSKGLQGSTTVEVNVEELKKAGWVLPNETSAGPPQPTAPTKPQQPSGSDAQGKPSAPAEPSPVQPPSR
jgi:hypothetical protein